MATQAPQDEDEIAASEVPMYLVRPSDNVYSFFMFIGPTESKKKMTDKCTWGIVMAYILVALNFVMQSVLVWLVFTSVVLANLDWQNGILKLNTGAIGGLFEEAPSKCNEGGSLCFVDSDGGYTCSPPSIQLTGRWNELDVNGDGMWTWKEVQGQREELRCKYVVDPQEVFLVLVEMLKKRENIIWLHPDVKAGKAIHYPYFQYILGDLVMCRYRSQDMCANLLKRGFFHSPLKHGTAPRVGTTIESALRYCRDLLQPGGTCETLLPSTYATWKIQSQGECGSPDYSKFVYENPGLKVSKSLLEVDYSVRGEYDLAQQPHFRVFKGIILFVWFLLMFCEFKEVWKIIIVVMRYPDAADFGEDAVLMEQDPSDPEDVRYRIQGITRSHRRIMAVLCLLRIGVNSLLLFVGMSYIIRTNGYVDLLMNGVTLLFVADVANILYSQVLREEIRDQTEDIKAMKVPMYGWDWLNRRPALLDIVSVGVLILLVYAVMSWNLTQVTVPIYDALECTCLASGPKCREAQFFNRAWWDNYWMKIIPGVFKEVDTLKTTVPGAALFIGAPQSRTMDMSSALLFHEQLESRVEKLSSDNVDLETTIEKLEKEMAGVKMAQLKKARVANTTISATTPTKAVAKSAVKAAAKSTAATPTKPSTPAMARHLTKPDQKTLAYEGKLRSFAKAKDQLLTENKKAANKTQTPMHTGRRHEA
jgi:hypothetical protein